MECLISWENPQNLVKEYEWLRSQFANTLSHFQFKHKSQNILSIEPWTSSWGSYCSRMLIISYHIQTCCSVAQSYPRHHGLKHTRLPYPSLSPRVCSISCLLGWCYNPTISSSALPTFSSCPVFLNMRIFSSESALQVAKVLELQFHHQSFQWLFGVDIL